MSNETDGHHISHHAKEHELRPQSRYIRRLPTMIPEMYRPVHNELHKHCPPVPVLGYYALQRVANDMYDTDDTFDTLQLLYKNIEKANKHPHAKPLERQLGDLVIATYQAQEPYLRDGMVAYRGKPTIIT